MSIKIEIRVRTLSNNIIQTRYYDYDCNDIETASRDAVLKARKELERGGLTPKDWVCYEGSADIYVW